MKKLLIAITAMAALSSSAYTESEQRQINAATAYVTNDAAKADCAVFCNTNEELCIVLDDILYAKPPLYVLRHLKNARLMPRTFAAALDAYAETKPVTVRRARLGASIATLSNEDRVEYTVEYWSSRFGNVVVPSQLKSFKSELGRCLGKLIIKTLRRQGKAVVTGPDGMSPVKAYADRISAALDAPHFEGLNEILSEMGINARMDPSRLNTAEEANALIDKIMNGERMLRARDEVIISTALGVEAYNQFVERYNGGN